ncbi:LPXTG cell wall anchor domain-containing protein [Streptomyces sp. NBC_01571]|uniref:LPXTG cell wall anchor domain-containing protein n=1 Tax=Streptomyces sp. NBC_01571 TaxID=2975883 RepID=UPI00224DCB3B|nr:LPXTG cell wall anchor domain-containing protein [Streptomyces sp. NBC_01571]MCX4576971.1 LPXTG cell wall anchor domain-containing protein [Streptomyces sp. NBC_01571]
MKLRRAMAVAAATAAIAPLALLSAPTAFASDDSSSPSASVSESTSASASASASSSDSAPAPSASESASGSAPAPSGSASASASESGKPSASATPSQSAEPSAWPTEDCPVDDDGVDAGSQLSLAVSGLPGKIVAGSGWHNFTLSAANHSDQDLGQVQWLATVDNYSDSDDENDWLSTYAQLEYFNPTSKSWESIADEVGNGIYFGETTLGGKQTVAIKLRVNISSKAPAGDGYALGLGGYVDQEKDCVHSSFAFYELTVLAAGSSNENPGKPKPGKGDKPSGGTKPQGGADEIPATGSLASTGSSSALPTIALVGGIAVVAGAGAVFTVRRRKSGGAAA